VLVVEGANWSFRSDLVRDVAYSTLTKADRARRHYGIAHYFETAKPPPADPSQADERFIDTVAHHYGLAAELVAELGPVSGIGDDVTDAALRWVGEAAQRAELGQVLPVAVRLFGQALRLAPDRPDLRVGFLLGRARALSELRELDDAAADLSEAQRLADELDDEAGRARADLVAGELLQRRGDSAEGLVVLRRAVDRFRAIDDLYGAADALRAQGMIHLLGGDNDRAEVVISEALETSRALDDRRGEAWAVQQLAWISFLAGRAVEAERRLLVAVQIFEEIGDTGGWGWAQGLLAYAMYQQGRLDEAGELGDLILVQAHERGDLWGEGMMSVLSASVRLWSGRATEAVGRAEAATDLFRRLGDLFGELSAMSVLGRSLVVVGRIDEGFRALDEAASRSMRAEADGLTTIGVSALAGASVQLGEPHRAEVAFEGLDEAWVQRCRSGDIERLVALGVAHLQNGRIDEAERCLRHAVSFDGEADASPYAMAGLALALAAAGCDDEVLELDKRVNQSARASYLDKGTAKLSALLVRARRGEADAASRFEAVVAAADSNDDLVAQAVARLTQAYGLEALGAPEAAEVRRDAERRLDHLGLDAPGWRNAIELILAASPAPPTPQIA
jgi:tetratricopeptide (TPR) repeat protein